MDHVIQYILWAYFLFYPLYGYLTIARDKKMLDSKPDQRLKVYQSTIIHLWLPTLLIGYLVFDNRLTFKDIGLTFSMSLTSITTIIISVFICGYFIYSLKALENYTFEKREELKKGLAHVSWFMPQNKQQRNWMVMGVSTSAGVCEEILFRGYLMYQLGLYLNDIYALVISSTFFGFGHCYQGWQHIIRTGIMGAIFAGIYLLSDSLIACIILHIALDAYGSQLSYCINTHKN